MEFKYSGLGVSLDKICYDNILKFNKDVIYDFKVCSSICWEFQIGIVILFWKGMVETSA